MLAALRKQWAMMDAPAGKRMAPFLPEITAVCGRGELDNTDYGATKLSSICAATIDRRLAGERARLQLKGRPGTSRARR